MQSSQRSGVSSECLFRASELSYRQLLLLLACYLSNNLMEINYRYEVVEGAASRGQRQLSAACTAAVVHAVYVPTFVESGFFSLQFLNSFLKPVPEQHSKHAPHALTPGHILVEDRPRRFDCPLPTAGRMQKHAAAVVVWESKP